MKKTFRRLLSVVLAAALLTLPGCDLFKNVVKYVPRFPSKKAQLTPWNVSSESQEWFVEFDPKDKTMDFPARYSRTKSGINFNYTLDLFVFGSHTEAEGDYVGHYTLDMKGDLGKIGEFLNNLASGHLTQLIEGHSAKTTAQIRFHHYDEASFKEFEKQASELFEPYRKYLPSEAEQKANENQIIQFVGNLSNSEKPKVKMDRYEPLLMFYDYNMSFDPGQDETTLMLTIDGMAGFTAYMNGMMGRLGWNLGETGESEDVPKANMPWSILLMADGTAVCTIYTIDEEHPVRILGSWGPVEPVN